MAFVWCRLWCRPLPHRTVHPFEMTAYQHAHLHAHHRALHTARSGIGRERTHHLPLRLAAAVCVGLSRPPRLQTFIATRFPPRCHPKRACASAFTLPKITLPKMPPHHTLQPFGVPPLLGCVRARLFAPASTTRTEAAKLPSTTPLRRGLCTRVHVAGVGLTDFVRPGARPWTFVDMVEEATGGALRMAGVDVRAIDFVVGSYVKGESTATQRAVYPLLGHSGVPVLNINNNCASGSAALYTARRLIQARAAQCVLVVGFERMQAGALEKAEDGQPHPLDSHIAALRGFAEYHDEPLAPWMFACAAREYAQRHRLPADAFALVAHKNHAHGRANPNGFSRRSFTLDQIMRMKMVVHPLTVLQCSPPCEGASAAVLCSSDFLHAHRLGHTTVEVVGQGFVTDMADTFTTPMQVVGEGMTRRAAAAAFQDARENGVKLTMRDVGVVEIHDCFSSNELMTYEYLGMCGEGEGYRLLRDGQCTYGGRWVVNPSGGLLAKGHPLGATGVAQCAELVWQLLGQAGERQVQPHPTHAFQHNIGLGGAAVCTIYSRA